MIAAAMAIADSVTSDELNASYIVPSVFDPVVAPAVAAAVRHAVEADASPIADSGTNHHDEEK
jgi:malate dehydrogenase (oxaloacetate-decarboxylating)